MPGRRREKRAPAPFPRTARVNEVLREVVAEELERMADTDDRLRLLTVTSVDITPDLSRATVYLSSLPPLAIEALAEQRTQLQRTIGRQVRMKRTPLLEFESDPAVAHGLRVEEILRNLREAPSGPDGAGGDDAGGR
jgi:ribosome-binding factor A